jgi:hypothetical protein
MKADLLGLSPILIKKQNKLNFAFAIHHPFGHYSTREQAANYGRRNTIRKS